MVSSLRSKFLIFPGNTDDTGGGGGPVLHLEKLLCSETDLDCLSQICPLSMRFNREKDRCEDDGPGGREVSTAGIVGNTKLMCREGFVWVQWKSQCLRKT